MNTIITLTVITGIAVGGFFATQKLRNFANTVQVLVVGVPSIDLIKGFSTGIIPIKQNFKLNNHSKFTQKIDGLSATLYHSKNGEWKQIAGSKPSNGFTIQPNSANPFSLLFEAPILDLPLSAITSVKDRKFKADVHINIGGQLIDQTVQF